MKRSTAVGALILIGALVLVITQLSAQQPAPAKKQVASPPAETSVSIADKTITIKYGAPSVRDRKMFGEGGVISKDKTYPVWRLGANPATSLHTDADLVIKNLTVPKGDYTLFALVNTDPWQLIVNKQTGQWGLAYNQDQDLGRVPMDMTKPTAPIETLKISLSSTGANAGTLQVEFENYTASVLFTVK